MILLMEKEQADSILIRLLSDGENITWLSRDKSGQVISGPQSGTLSSLKNIPPAAQITVTIPGADVLLTSVSLPKRMKQSHIAKAVSYALEDKLSEDTEQLHFAYRQINPHELAIAVVKHEVMRAVLEKLKQYHLMPSQLVPETLALPVQAKTWTLYLDKHFALVRTGQDSAFTIDVLN